MVTEILGNNSNIRFHMDMSILDRKFRTKSVLPFTPNCFSNSQSVLSQNGYEGMVYILQFQRIMNCVGVDDSDFLVFSLDCSLYYVYTW